MASRNLSIALHQNVASLFANPNGDSATKLSALINKDLGSEGFKRNTTSLDALLSSITNQLNLSSFAHRETIDEYVNFVAFTSLQINNEATHPGTILREGEERLYRVAPLHPASGPRILGQNLAKTLFDSLWDATSRAVTPDVDTDRDQPKEYYYKASVYATVLARAFSLAESFRDVLWKDVEDILVKALFSGDEQEPGVFVALTAILLGAANEIEVYLNGEDKGQGKSWLWYDDVRTESDSTWGWKDVVQALKIQPGPEMVDRLPEYVKDNIELTKKHVASGEGSWDSKRLASEAFRWASVDS